MTASWNVVCNEFIQRNLEKAPDALVQNVVLQLNLVLQLNKYTYHF